MPFDPNAFTEDVRRRREQQATIAPPSADQGSFNPSQYSGDTSGQPQQPQATVGDLATSAGLFGGSAAATAYGLNMIPGMKGPVATPGMVYNAVGQPILQSTGNLFREYVADPLRGARDVAASKVAPGVIPAQVVRGALPTISDELTKIVGQLPKGTDVNADQFLRGLTNEDKAKFVEQFNREAAKSNPSKALETTFKSFQAPEYLDDAGKAALKSVQQGFPSGMSKLATAGKILGRTAARFAGPAGMALTAYDIYELGSEMYDRYKQNQPVAPVAPTTPAAPAPQMAPVVPANTGADTFDMDRRIREEAYRRALGQR